LFSNNRLKPSFKTIGISKFIWQRVPDCRTSVIKSPTAVGLRAKSAARNSETIQSQSGVADSSQTITHNSLFYFLLQIVFTVLFIFWTSPLITNTYKRRK